MIYAKIFLYVLFVIYFIIMFFTYKKSRKLFKMLLLIFIQGITAFFAVNLIGNFIEVHIPLNYYTITFSGLFGISGVAMLLLFQVFLS